MSNVRLKETESAVWTSLAVNGALSMLKGIGGSIAGSRALVADAAYSASQAAVALTMLLGRKRTGTHSLNLPLHNKKRKIEARISVAIAAILIVIGFDLAVRAIQGVNKGPGDVPDYMAVAILIASLLVKEIMYQYESRQARRHTASVRMAAARAYRSSMYSSLIALCGAGGAMIGAQWNIPVLFYLDDVAGAVIALTVMFAGYRMIMEAIARSADQKICEEDTRDLYRTVVGVPGVITVDHLRAWEHGYYLNVDIKITVNPGITVHEGNYIGKEVRTRILRGFTHVNDVVIQVNPYDPGYPYKYQIDSTREDFPKFIH